MDTGDTAFMLIATAMVMGGVAGVLCYAAIVYSVILTFIILKMIDLTIGLRVEIDDETQGLDVTSHGKVGTNS